jgi:fluoride exporter
MLLRVLLVALGGAVGSALRYVIGLGLTALAGEAWLPIPTLTVNVVGCFALGLLMAAWPEPTLLRLALTTGVIGGFTTYSAFNFETWELARHGEAPLAVGYVVVTLGACLVAGTIGAWLGGGIPSD